MSEDVNTDIQKAIEDAKDSSADNGNGPIIPPPNILKHGLNKDDVSFPDSKYGSHRNNK